MAGAPLSPLRSPRHPPRAAGSRRRTTPLRLLLAAGAPLGALALDRREAGSASVLRWEVWPDAGLGAVADAGLGAVADARLDAPPELRGSVKVADAGLGAVADAEFGAMADAGLDAPPDLRGSLKEGPSRQVVQAPNATRGRQRHDVSARRSGPEHTETLSTWISEGWSGTPLQNTSNPWKIITQRKSRIGTYRNVRTTMIDFIESVSGPLWLLFIGSTAIFVYLQLTIINRLPLDNKLNLARVIGLWAALAVFYNAVVFATAGKHAGIEWMAGYLQEIIFAAENIFAFLMVIETFHMPVQLTTKALFLVVIAQICFQCGIYMGMSNWLATQTWLPYALGVWLLYLGIASLFQDHSGHTDDVNVEEFWVVKAFSTLSFGRFKPQYFGEHSLFVWQDHRCYATMLVLVTGVLVLVDFTLEVDVTLVKIECISNPYIAFSSSAVAAFSVPELFFVVRMLFERYSALKYGISFILVMFGLELILESVFTVPALAGCGAVLLVMVFCICISPPPPEPSKAEAAAAAAAPPPAALGGGEQLLRQSASAGCLAFASQPTTHPLAAPGHGQLVPGAEEGRRRAQTMAV